MQAKRRLWVYREPQAKAVAEAAAVAAFTAGERDLDELVMTAMEAAEPWLLSDAEASLMLTWAWERVVTSR